jgi:hypothetical protein
MFGFFEVIFLLGSASLVRPGLAVFFAHHALALT